MDRIGGWVFFGLFSHVYCICIPVACLLDSARVSDCNRAHCGRVGRETGNRLIFRTAEYA